MTAMPVDRRRLIGMMGGLLAVPVRAAAHKRGALVIVRNELGLRYVDPQTGTFGTWDGPLPATPVARTISTVVPAAVASPVTEGVVSYWMASPDGNAFAFRLDTGASSSWWWRRDGGKAVPLNLPGQLEPAFPSGTAARWFHGATVDDRHLGAGTLRLVAVDIETGEVALDHELDRRLELAATAVSDGGAIVAHVQSSATAVAFWAADLRDGARLIDAGVVEEPGAAAASAIELDVAEDGNAVLVAAGLIRDAPGAPAATVYILRVPGAAGIVSLPGELIGIVSENGP
jgi:hypothetical protein